MSSTAPPSILLFLWAQYAKNQRQQIASKSKTTKHPPVTCRSTSNRWTGATHKTWDHGRCWEAKWPPIGPRFYKGNVEQRQLGILRVSKLWPPNLTKEDRQVKSELVWGPVQFADTFTWILLILVVIQLTYQHKLWIRCFFRWNPNVCWLNRTSSFVGWTIFYWFYHFVAC